MAHRAVITPRRRALLMAAGACVLLGRGAASRAGVDPRRALLLERALRAGDVVLRSGLSIESTAVLSARPQSRFSHVGIAVNSEAGIRVVHALPPEGTFRGGVVSSPWNEFAFSAEVRAVAAFRVQGASPEERGRIARTALQWLGTAFNSDLALGPGHGVYCTQLALSALASVDASVARFVRPSAVAFLPEPVFLPDSLLDWPRLVELRA